MFRHARQLDLARRLNHADRKERILISLETSREILFVKEHGPLFFPSPSRLLPASPTFRTFSLLLLPVLFSLPRFFIFSLSCESSSFVRPYGSTYRAISFSLRRRSQRLRVEIVSSLLQLRAAEHSTFSPFFLRAKTEKLQRSRLPP